jgi:hypothetical protein
MSYELMITRADSQLSAIERPISRAEWEAAAQSDPIIVLASDAFEDVKTDAGMERRHAWVLKADPKAGGLWYEDGGITAYSPNQKLIVEMVAIAKKLNAKVVGEEDEVYGEDGQAKK